MKQSFILFLCLFFTRLTVTYAQNRETSETGGFSSGKSFVRNNAKGQKQLLLQAPGGLKKIMNLHPESDLVKLEDRHDKKGRQHQVFRQTHKGIKVEYSRLSVVSSNGVIEALGGELYEVPQSIDAQPVITEASALESALKYIGAEKYKWENEQEEAFQKKLFGKGYSPVGDLVFVKKTIGPHDNDEMALAYKFDIYAQAPLSRRYIYVDAHTGKVVHENAILTHVDGPADTRYSGRRNISTTFFGGNNLFALRDASRSAGIETYNMRHSTEYSNVVDFTDTDNVWSSSEFNNANKDNAALDAHWGASMTYDYFKTLHGRDSYDNLGSKIYNFVHYDTDYANAFWNGVSMNYGDGNSSLQPFVSLDICAHEIGHGVCSNSANLVYSNESGALNESLSDIWAATIEHYAAPEKNFWEIGEETGSAFRSLSDPNAHNQPDTYLGHLWHPTGATSDFGGVHTNSGVMNHWYYLLVNGGNGENDFADGFIIVGIGFDKAADIVYRMETVYLTPNSGYAEARTAAVQAATDLFGSASVELGQVHAAWDAVGVYDHAGAPTNLTATATSPTSIHLSWTDNSSIPIASFIVERSHEITGVFVPITEVSGDTFSYDNTGLTTGSTFFYRVRARLNDHRTAFTNTVTVPLNPIIMANGDITACNSPFVDPGNSTTYQPNLDITMTVRPEQVGKMLRISFSEFFLAGRTTEAIDDAGFTYDIIYNDSLIIHDGIDKTAPVLGAFVRDNLPPDITATNPAGALTFHFISLNQSERGWKADFFCEDKINPPTNLTSQTSGNHEIDLSWNDNSTDETGFVLERRSLTDPAFEVVATLNPNTTHYADANLAFNDNYTYRIRAARATVRSAYSNTVEVVLGQTPLLIREGNFQVCDVPFLDDGGHKNYPYGDGFEKFPYNIAATFTPPVTGTKMRITFDSFNLPDTITYLVVYDGGSADFSHLPMHVLRGNSIPTAITATNPEGKLTIQFLRNYSIDPHPDMSAIATAFDSGHAGWEARLTCVSPAAAPLLLNGNILSASQINLTWQDQANDETGYVVEKSTGGMFQTVATLPANTTSYLNTNLTINRHYIYRVRSLKDDVLSDPSNTVSFTLGSEPLLMKSATVNTCSATFLDSGGDENYANLEDGVLIIQPDVSGARVTVDFASFKTENIFDYLEIYDGNSVTATKLGKFMNNSLPPHIVASTAGGGALTFKFHSDEYVRAPGWTASIGCAIDKSQPVITFDPGTKTFGDPPFNFSASAYNGADFVYSIVEDGSNTGQVTLSGTGNTTATLVKAGTVKIKASLNETSQFFAAEKVGVLTINKATPNIVFSDLTRTYGDQPFDLNATAYNGAVFNYSIVLEGTNTGDVTLSGSNNKTVTIVKAGDVKLKATLATSDNYSGGEAVMILHITKATPNIVFSDLTRTYGDQPFDLNATAYNGAIFNYSIVSEGTNTGDVTLSGSNNKTVAIVKAGDVKLRATLAASDNYSGGEAVMILHINKATPNIVFSDLTKTYGDQPFDLNATAYNGAVFNCSIVLDGTNTGDVTLSGSNNKTVTIVKAGDVKLKATLAASDNYAGGEAIITLHINKATPNILFSDLTKTYGDQPFDLNATAYNGAVFNYSIVSDGTSTGDVTLSNTNSKTVTIVKAGDVKLKATLAESDNYFAGEAQMTLRIVKATPDLAFEDLVKIYGDPPFTLNATAFSNAVLRFSIITNTANSGEVALSGTNNRDVTILRAGIVKILVSVDENETYMSAEKEMTLTILKASQVINFSPLQDKLANDQPFPLTASASSNLPVSFTVVGPATLSGPLLSLSGFPGLVVVQADQPGDNNYAPAPSVVHSFEVTSIPSENEILVWPVPTDQFLTIDAGTNKITKVEITDILGRNSVLSLPSMASTWVVDLRDQSSGTYLMNIYSDNGQRTVRRFVIVR